MRAVFQRGKREDSEEDLIWCDLQGAAQGQHQ